MEEKKLPATTRLTLFYSYVDEDEELQVELEKHLQMLQRQGTITSWHHHKIMPGTHVKQMSNEQLEAAKLILLLISPDFLASDAAHAEMEVALRRHQSGQAHIIPLLLRPVDWESTSLAQFQWLPRNGLPVTMWGDRDQAFVHIAKEIRLMVEQGMLASASGLSTEATPLPASPFPFVFLSYAHKDLVFTKRLKESLLAEEIIGWVDHQVSSSSLQKEHLREAMCNASAVILVVSPSTRRSRSVKAELQIAEMYQRPIYVWWVQGNQLSEVIPADGHDFLSFDARGERYQEALQELLHILRKQTISDLPTQKELPLSITPRNPYKGLQAFRQEDAQDFFGRTHLIDELVEKVRQILAAHSSSEVTARLLTIVGASGSGKSSVVMAGLLPKLQHGALPDSHHWIYLDPIVPGQHPIEALILVLSSLFPARSLKSIREDLEDDSTRGLHLLLATCVRQTTIKAVLLIDQLEELFTQTPTEEERSRFLDLLLAAVTEPAGPLFVVMTLRADFYDRPLQYPELGRLIGAQQVTAYPLEPQDLRAVIEQPAHLPDVQLIFEEDLVGDLLFEVQGQQGALPLLQFTLDQLFHQRQGYLLTRRAYHEIGGVQGALAQHAEKTYQSLSTLPHQKLARALFLRLINSGTMEQDATKRRISLTELVVTDSQNTLLLAEVTNTFTSARLLTATTIGDISTIEVSHEALLRVWDRLREWFHEARDEIRLQQAISEDAVEWQRHGRVVDRLYRGSQLAEALQWRTNNLPSRDEESFLQTSIEEHQRIRQVERQQRLVYTRRVVLIGATTGIVGIIGTSIFLNRIYGNVPVSIPVTPTSFPYSYNVHTAAVNSVAWSPDGKLIASAGDDNTVQVWNAATGNTLLTYTKHANGVNSVAWSPDGKLIASAGQDNTVQVWNAATGNTLLTYTKHTNIVVSVAWSPDGKLIASAGQDKTVQVWNAATGNTLFTYTKHTDFVNSVAWSPDGKLIASAGQDKTVQVWNAVTDNTLLTYTKHTDFVYSVAWSPDGKLIASVGLDNTVQVWNAVTGNTLLTYTNHTDFVNSVAWSPDGKLIASAGGDNTVQVWNAATGNTLLTYTKHTDFVNSVAWSPDGKLIASAGNDKTVRVWNTATGNTLLTYTNHTAAVYSVAWSPDGKLIASAGLDNTVQVWWA